MPFPKGCQELRVFGYYDSGKEGSKQKKWRRFKNKVYSIDRGNKIFTLIAMDDELEMFT